MLRIDSKLARALGAFGMAAFIAVAAGCGGGGSGGSTSTSSTGGSATNVFTPTGAVSSTPATLASNQMAVVVSTGLTGRAANIPMVSVTVCVPGSGTCQTINNVQLDTGSFGLRLAKAALNSTMLSSLPVETLIGGACAADVDEGVLREFAEEGLAGVAGDLAWWLPYRVRRWPWPSMII